MKRKQAYKGGVCQVVIYKYYLFFFFPLMPALFTPASAQFYTPSDKTIRLGESIPESFYETVHKAVYSKTRQSTDIHLDKYRDKLIILDFWLTICGPCLTSLNKLDSIKTRMGNDGLAVIPVTTQRPDEVIPVFQRFQWNMISIVSDTILSQIFPYNSIPHQVWIKNGKVVAIPEWDYATGENIRKVIEGNPVQLVMNIQDRVVDPVRLLFVEGNGKTDLLYRSENSIIARHLPDYRSNPLRFIRSGDTSILYAVNQRLKYLYFDAYRNQIFPLLRLSAKNNPAIIWEISDKLRNRILKPPSKSYTGNYKVDRAYKEWLSKNSYGYNLRIPEKITEAEALQIMQQQLNYFLGTYLNLEAAIEYRTKARYAVLRLSGSRSESEKLLKASGRKRGVDHDNIRRRYYSMPFGQQFYNALFIALRGMPDLDLTFTHIVDSTGISKDFKTDFDLPRKMRDLSLVQQELKRYGLHLTIENKKIPVLVVREKGIKAATHN